MCCEITQLPYAYGCMLCEYKVCALSPQNEKPACDSWWYTKCVFIYVEVRILECLSKSSWLLCDMMVFISYLYSSFVDNPVWLLTHQSLHSRPNSVHPKASLLCFNDECQRDARYNTVCANFNLGAFPYILWVIFWVKLPRFLRINHFIVE